MSKVQEKDQVRKDMEGKESRAELLKRGEILICEYGRNFSAFPPLFLFLRVYFFALTES
jgi:hypothetical protein